MAQRIKRNRIEGSLMRPPIDTPIFATSFGSSPTYSHAGARVPALEILAVLGDS